MLLHILGGGGSQLSALKRCRAMGIKTLVSDWNPRAPGAALADYFVRASTFDPDQTVEALRRFCSRQGLLPDGILVIGTDQPVLTAALAAKELGISYFLTPSQALIATNKKVMKQKLRAAGIKTAPYVLLSRNSKSSVLESLSFPVVTKPLDSQGQRGVYRFDHPQDVFASLEKILSFSRKEEILVEEYYPSEEMTLSAWVEGGELIILSLTDRRTVDKLPGIGVCVSHHYPSRHASAADEIRGITETLVRLIGLNTGPLYIQFLKGREGIAVNEMACRLGGAYEDQFIPRITSVDILDVMIKMALGLDYGRPCPVLSGEGSKAPVISLQMFFCSEGRIQTMGGMEELCRMPGILAGHFLLAPGTSIRRRLDSSQRAGYFIVEAESKIKADKTVEQAYSLLRIEDARGNNMIEVVPPMFFGDKE